MNRQLLLITLSAIIAIASSIYYQSLTLSVIADKAPIVLSVFMAALFVRLARGLPTFPFERIARTRAIVIFAALQHLRSLYSHAFVSFMFAIVVSVAFSSIDPTLPAGSGKAVLTGFFVFSLLWALTTAYLIFQTDIAIFRSQSAAMEEVVSDAASQAAAESLATVRENLVRTER